MLGNIYSRWWLTCIKNWIILHHSHGHFNSIQCTPLPLQNNTPRPSSSFYPIHWCLSQHVGYGPGAAMHHQRSLHHNVSADKQTNSSRCQGRGEITASFHFPMHCPWTAMCHVTRPIIQTSTDRILAAQLSGKDCLQEVGCQPRCHVYAWSIIMRACSICPACCTLHTHFYYNQNYGLGCSNKIHTHIICFISSTQPM